MIIYENINEIICTITFENILKVCIFVGGFALFAFWFFKNSYGIRSLDDSVPRRNNLPPFLPMVLVFATLLFIYSLGDLSVMLSKDLPKWQQVLIPETVHSILGLISIGFILFIVRKYFVQGIKGFGLNIKTIHKDLAMAFISLLAIWPLLQVVFVAIISINEIVYGPNYTIPTHVELKTLAENKNIMDRAAIAVATVGVTPFLEEILFRGLFQTMIRSETYFYKYSAWVAIFITSLFFSLFHANASHWPILFILGACMGYSYEKSGSLFRPVFIHMLFNASAVIPTWLK